MHRFFLPIVALFFFIESNAPISAAPTEKVEQQLSILNRSISTTSTTAAPEDNSLGFFTWDASVYTNPSVDFEAIIACDSCSGGAAAAHVALYDELGNEISNVSVSTQNSTYTRVRVTDIGSYLTNDTLYTPKLKLDAVSGTAQLKSARLIIRQDSGSITNTRTMVNLGNYTNTTNTSYAALADPKIFHYNTTRMSAISSVYFHATLASSDEAGTAYAALSSNSTCSSIVSGSEVSITGTAYGHDISGDIKNSLAHNSEYWVCLKNSDGVTANLASAYLIINQADEGGIENISVYHHYNPSLITHDGDFLPVGYNNQYNPGNFAADRKKAYLEVVMKAVSNTASADLYNATNSLAIDNSLITSTSTAYARSISNELFSTLPSTTKDLDMRIKNSDSATTSLSSSWLIIHLSKTPDASLSFSISGVAAGVVNNGITTSTASTFNTLPFEHLTVTIPKYTAHQLYVSTNAYEGYRVTVKVLNYLQGNYPANNIDPFVGSWASPSYWTEPTGTTPNDNTGWIGANTTDTRVTGWSEGALKFGPVNSNENTVMISSAEDSGSTVYVTYALEANIWQPSDLYSGQIVYNLHPTY
jgi:hypothetical protein